MLYAMVTSPDTVHHWTLRGVIPPFAEFSRSFWQDVLVQFVVVRNDQEAPMPLGLVTADKADLHSGYVSITVVASPEALHTGALMDGVGLLLDYLFFTWPFRKVYLEASELAFAQYQSIVRRGIFEIEGTLKDHLYLDGQYWTQYILSSTRDQWLSHGRPMVERAQVPRPPVGR